MPFTVVSFHAHPDDESLLTGGTLARAAAEGHRVVLVTATDGSAGLASAVWDADLGRRRVAELEVAAEILGVARVVPMGWPDGRFSDLGVDGPAVALTRVLQTEGADVVTGYDEHGGYLHPDHVHVHRVARRAAGLAGTPVLLEASVDRTWLVRAARVVRLVPGTPDIDLETLRRGYLSRGELTHRVDVRAFAQDKSRALAAHVSQSSGGPRWRTVRLLGGLPGPLAAAVLGREWFREVGREPGPRLVDDPFASLR